MAEHRERFAGTIGIEVGRIKGADVTLEGDYLCRHMRRHAFFVCSVFAPLGFLTRRPVETCQAHGKSDSLTMPTAHPDHE
jgi:hypothetical protein